MLSLSVGQIWASFGPENGFFLINYIRILGFIWDLRPVLFDSPIDIVSGEI